ncbi:MAG: dinitrogenase iron-molybdenum cofactor biosynthesis protein [Asgard group archaeon]|nr:dinitrogenase iron-molybdenum cofactor biosynthesis protein [Asgard group archaeon]
MIIAFPVINDKGLDGLLADHFGRAPLFALYDTESKEVKTVDNGGDHFGGTEPVPTFLKGIGTNVLICKGLGRKAIMLFNDHDIGVFITQNSLVKDALELYNKNQLVQATETDGCSGSGHHH